MLLQKPFSQACENNKRPILEVLLRVFSDQSQVLEVGSGTGQHAVYFAQNLPHVIWQTADLEHNHSGINAWIDESTAVNIRRPIIFDADRQPVNIGMTDAIFTANTLHIMAWTSVINLFLGIDKLLVSDAILAVYGPFNYAGKFTSDSNAHFDQWLKQRGSHQGIRDFEAVNKLAEQAGLALLEDNDMPANNRLLVWQKAGQL